MTTDEMKDLHLKLHEGIWINRNLDLLDEVMGETFRGNMGRGEPQSKEQMKEMLKQSWENRVNENKRPVRTEYHGKIAEGDLLAVWQTNYYSDGTSSEEVNLFKFENGKIATSKRFGPPPA